MVHPGAHETFVRFFLFFSEKQFAQEVFFTEKKVADMI